MKLTQSKINKGLISFINKSSTAFQAVNCLEAELAEAGYTKLVETDKWQLTNGGKYYVIRNNSALVAFCLSKGEIVESGINLVGAHTDSPALRVKPNPENKYKDYLTIAVEPYGGLNLASWFDRDLSLAGRVTYLNDSGELKNALIDFKRAIATVPNLAIHLNREMNDKRSINKQKEMPPLMLQSSKDVSFNAILLEELKREGVKNVKKIFDYELYFYDSNPAQIIGLNNDFLAASRIDNLASCYIGLKALLESRDKHTSMLVCNDHEECGSNSTTGAGGSFLKDVLERLVDSKEDFIRLMQNGLLISADNAHAVHPNYPEKHEGNHLPLLNAGPVIKINSNQRYATSSETAAKFLFSAEELDVPVQKFVVRSDMECGSTIGPITAKELGIRTLDIGLPTFGMHSIRELAGVKDALYLYKVLLQIFNK